MKLLILLVGLLLATAASALRARRRASEDASVGNADMRLEVSAAVETDAMKKSVTSAESKLDDTDVVSEGMSKDDMMEDMKERILQAKSPTERRSILERVRTRLAARDQQQPALLGLDAEEQGRLDLGVDLEDSDKVCYSGCDCTCFTGCDWKGCDKGCTGCCDKSCTDVDGTVNTATDWVEDTWEDAVDWVSDAAENTANALEDAVDTALEAVANFLNDLWNELLALTNLFDDAWDAITDFIDDAGKAINDVEGFTDDIAEVVDTAIDAVESCIPDVGGLLDEMSGVLNSDLLQQILPSDMCLELEFNVGFGYTVSSDVQYAFEGDLLDYLPTSESLDKLRSFHFSKLFPVYLFFIKVSFDFAFEMPVKFQASNPCEITGDFSWNNSLKICFDQNADGFFTADIDISSPTLTLSQTCDDDIRASASVGAKISTLKPEVSICVLTPGTCGTVSLTYEHEILFASAELFHTSTHLEDGRQLQSLTTERHMTIPSGVSGVSLATHLYTAKPDISVDICGSVGVWDGASCGIGGSMCLPAVYETDWGDDWSFWQDVQAFGFGDIQNTVEVKFDVGSLGLLEEGANHTRAREGNFLHSSSHRSKHNAHVAKLNNDYLAELRAETAANLGARANSRGARGRFKSRAEAFRKKGALEKQRSVLLALKKELARGRAAKSGSADQTGGKVGVSDLSGATNAIGDLIDEIVGAIGDAIKEIEKFPEMLTDMALGAIEGAGDLGADVVTEVIETLESIDIMETVLGFTSINFGACIAMDGLTDLFSVNMPSIPKPSGFDVNIPTARVFATITLATHPSISQLTFNLLNSLQFYIGVTPFTAEVGFKSFKVSGFDISGFTAIVETMANAVVDMVSNMCGGSLLEKSVDSGIRSSREEEQARVEGRSTANATASKRRTTAKRVRDSRVVKDFRAKRRKALLQETGAGARTSRQGGAMVEGKISVGRRQAGRTESHAVAVEGAHALLAARRGYSARQELLENGTKVVVVTNNGAGDMFGDISQLGTLFSEISSEVNGAMGQIESFAGDGVNKLYDYAGEALKLVSSLASTMGDEVASFINDNDILETFGLLPLKLDVFECLGVDFPINFVDIEFPDIPEIAGCSGCNYIKFGFDSLPSFPDIKPLSAAISLPKFGPLGVDPKKIVDAVNKIIQAIIDAVTQAITDLVSCISDGAGLVQDQESAARNNATLSATRRKAARAEVLLERLVNKQKRRLERSEANSFLNADEGASTHVGASCSSGDIVECVDEITDDINKAFESISEITGDAEGAATDLINTAVEAAEVAATDFMSIVEDCLPDMGAFLDIMKEALETMIEIAPKGFEIEIEMEVSASYIAETPQAAYAYSVDGFDKILDYLPQSMHQTFNQVRSFSFEEAFPIPLTPFLLKLAFESKLEMPMDLYFDGGCSIEVAAAWKDSLVIKLDPDSLSVDISFPDASPTIEFNAGCNVTASAGLRLRIADFNPTVGLCIVDTSICADIVIDFEMDGKWSVEAGKTTPALNIHVMPLVILFGASVELFDYDGSGSYESPTTGRTITFSGSPSPGLSLAYNAYVAKPTITVTNVFTVPSGLDFSNCEVEMTGQAVADIVLFDSTDEWPEGDAFWEIQDIWSSGVQSSYGYSMPHTHTPHSHTPHDHAPHEVEADIHSHNPHDHNPHDHVNTVQSSTKVPEEDTVVAQEYFLNGAEECAGQYETCTCTGLVYYGSSEINAFATKYVQSSISCSHDVFGDPARSCRPFQHCANENENCACTGQVMYGAGTSFYANFMEGTIGCNIGDPLSGHTKACYCDNYGKCADEGNYGCSCTGITMMGTDKAMHTYTQGGSFCSTDFHGEHSDGQANDCWCESHIWVASENEQAECTGAVTFGEREFFSTTRKVIDSKIACTNSVFGDPSSGTKKNCFCEPYTVCAESSAEVCECDGTVAYGYGQSFVEKFVSPKVPCKPEFFGQDSETDSDGNIKKCMCLNTSPRQGVAVARQNYNAWCAGEIYYGLDGSWTSAKHVIGLAACNDNVFGDPYHGVSKECRCFPYEHCANEGETCQCNGRVIYGQALNVYSKEVQGSVSCSASVFGDPAYGYAKSCYCLTFGNDESHEYVGCKSGGGSWTRPFGDVPTTVDGAESCLSQCKSAGYSYGGMECPMSDDNEVHCQCSNSNENEFSLVSDSTCSGSYVYGHCDGAATSGAYLNGAYGYGSVYKLV